jgi:glutaredoxin
VTQAEVIVYSRPGCPYCYLLHRGLRRRGVTFTEIDIRQHPEAAAAVRAVAGGSVCLSAMLNNRHHDPAESL